MLNGIITRLAQLNNCTQDLEGARNCNTTLPEVEASSTSLQTVLTLVFGVITAVAVLIIVVQGIKYVLSQGEPDKTAQARKGIIYAAVGLVIVFMADVFVAFFLKRII